jgi:hypothetical protein
MISADTPLRWYESLNSRSFVIAARFRCGVFDFREPVQGVLNVFAEAEKMYFDSLALFHYGQSQTIFPSTGYACSRLSVAEYACSWLFDAAYTFNSHGDVGSHRPAGRDLG